MFTTLKIRLNSGWTEKTWIEHVSEKIVYSQWWKTWSRSYLRPTYPYKVVCMCACVAWLRRKPKNRYNWRQFLSFSIFYCKIRTMCKISLNRLEKLFFLKISNYRPKNGQRISKPIERKFASSRQNPLAALFMTYACIGRHKLCPRNCPQMPRQRTWL